MLYHTNLIGKRVMIHDDDDTPQEFWGKSAVIRSSWLDVQTGEPRYTLAVQQAAEPFREFYVCSHDRFRGEK